ncbi:MAG: hypothetical protein H6872_03720 [Methylobacteriaceae bacterium]|nr:hypothetical protein [Methylobacteriaceae bacterium]
MTHIAVAEQVRSGRIADPRLAWAIAHPENFPLDVNRAPRDMLLRVPGLGARAVDRIIAARRHAAIRLVDLDRLTGGARKIGPFVATADWRPSGDVDPVAIQSPEKIRQLDLFGAPPARALPASGL